MTTSNNATASTEKPSAGLNRRDFLKGALIAGTAVGAGALTGCSPQATAASSGAAAGSGATAGGAMTASSFNKAQWAFETPPTPVAESMITETVTSDTIVIGSGVAGLVTAASLLNSGGKVVLFSAGTKAVSRGGSNHAIGTKTTKRLGLNYTPDTVVEHFQNEISRQGYRIDCRKWWTWINKSGEAMDWITDIMDAAGYTTTLEVPYTDQAGGVFSIPCGAHNFYGPEIDNSANFGEPLLTNTLEKYIKSKGGEIRYSTKAEYLERANNNTGRVTGVIASNVDGNYVRFEGTKAVVLATGDYSGSPDLMARYCSAYQDMVIVEGNDYDAEFQFGGLMPGDGQKMGLWAGAAWQHTLPSAPMIGWYGFPAPESDMNHPGILLNKEGQRFMNESSTSVYAGYTIMCQSDNAVYTVLDNDFFNLWPTWNGLGVNMDKLGLQPLTSAEKRAEIEAGVQSGGWVKGNSIEEVLSKLEGLDTKAAAATIERYNGYCESKHDDDFHKDALYLNAIKNGPFYGAVNTIGSSQFLCVLGGLRTSDKMEVLDANNKPIEGLYNVGTGVGDAFGTFYNFRVPGQNLGMNCVTHPYLLGQLLAKK